MKHILPSLFLLLLAFAACKKDNPPSTPFTGPVQNPGDTLVTGGGLHGLEQLTTLTLGL